MTQNNKIIKYLYVITITFLTLTGFAQMPIFKRYRIADIPGLGWLAEFYVTHSMHYIFASLLIAICAYIFVDYLLIQYLKLPSNQITEKSRQKPAKSRYAKALILAGLIITGGLMVFKNLSGTPYPPIMISMLNLSHLGFCMALLLYSTIFVIIKH